MWTLRHYIAHDEPLDKSTTMKIGEQSQMRHRYHVID